MTPQLSAIMREAELFRVIAPPTELRDWYESRLSELNLPAFEYAEAIKKLFEIIERGHDAT